MARSTFGLLLAALVFAGCAPRVAEQEPGDYDFEAVASANHVIGPAIRHGNLTVFPVSSSKPRLDDRYVTLDEGLTAGTIEIREIGGDGRSAFGNAAPNPAGQQQGEAPNQPSVNRPPVVPQPSLPPDDLNLGFTRNTNRQAPRAPPPANAQPAQTPPSQSNTVPPSPVPQPQAQTIDDEEPLGQQQGRQSSGPSVNTVVVVNRSTKPLFLTAGDIMIGGQQDRVIGQEIVVVANGQPTEVPVFCVEHGRWEQRDAALNVNYLQNVNAAAGVVQSGEQVAALAEKANQGQFVKGAGVVTKDVRLAVQGAMDQGKVWDEVAVANSKNRAMSRSGAFTANYGEKEIADKLKPYLGELQTRIAEQRNVVGVIVAVNGKPHSLDVFESTPLFQKLWPKLLKSYALDALGTQQEAESKAECKITKAADCLAKSLAASDANQTVKGGLRITRGETDDMVCFTVAKPVYGVDYAERQHSLNMHGAEVSAVGRYGERTTAGAQPAPAKAAPIHFNAFAK